MKYIPLKEANKEALGAWLQKSNEILDEMKKEPDAQKRKAIIHKNKTHWRDAGLLEFLKKLSDGKCWYTEAKFTAEYPHLEHFRPKSYARDEDGAKFHAGYWWLAFDIENYRLSKPVPNIRKGTYFPLRKPKRAVCEPDEAVSCESPLFLDPVNEDDAALIGFNSLGQPEPCKEPTFDLDEWDKRRIEFSIKRYGLDDQDLCDQRKALWVSICAMLDEYYVFGTKAKNTQCKESAGRALQIKKELRKFLDPKHEFTGLIINCFNTHEVGRKLYPQLSLMQMAA
jgi:5-methylcytosine-specific restriction endonuclease McrA